MRMNKNLMVWPKSTDVVHINYHYTQFGEYIDYLDKKCKGNVLALDLDVEDVDLDKYIEDNNIEKVAMQINYENSKNAFDMIEHIKSMYDIPIMAYGSIPRMFPELFLNSNVDMIINDGDDEICIESFFENYVRETDISDIKSKVKGGRIIKDKSFIETAKGEYIQDNEWGYSRKELVPISKYDEKKGKNRYVLNISRGCPFGCPHCLIQITEGNKERRRSISNVDNAIFNISAMYKHIKIWAANFTLDRNYVNDFCDMMIKKHPGITWECATRIELVKNLDMLNKMHLAGCKQVSLGIESLNNKKLINTKDFNYEEIDSAIKNIQQSGMAVKGCIMLGMPNQTREDIMQTLKFLKDRNVIVRPTIYTPYQMLDKHINIEDLAQYNRKTLENNNVENVSSKQLFQLVESPYDYESILNNKNNIEI